MAAYGDYGPGYIGTAAAYREGGYETSASASNVAPAAEEVLTAAMKKLLDETGLQPCTPKSSPSVTKSPAVNSSTPTPSGSASGWRSWASACSITPRSATNWSPCAEVFRRAIDRADVVVATGGLGPTADDLTREALAQATGRPLQLDPEALEYIRACSPGGIGRCRRRTSCRRCFPPAAAWSAIRTAPHRASTWKCRAKAGRPAA